MNAKKLNYWIWGTLIGAFVLTVAMVLVWKFKFYDQVVQKLDTSTKAYATSSGNAAKLSKTRVAALLAYQKLGLAQGELAYFRTRYRSLQMNVEPDPVAGFGPRDATFVRYLNEYSRDFGLAARGQLIRAADESGVKIDTSIKVDAPPQNPEDVKAPDSGFLKPETDALDVTVTGTLDDILRFFQIINRSEILMVVGNVKLEGLSPSIKASFTLTPYLLVTGNSAKQKEIPGLAGGASTTGAAGAAGTTGAAGAAGTTGAAGGDPRATESSGSPTTSPTSGGP